MLVADTAAHERLAVLTQSQVTSRIDVAPSTRTLQVTTSMEFHLRSYLRDPRYGIREVIEVRLIVGGRVSDRRGDNALNMQFGMCEHSNFPPCICGPLLEKKNPLTRIE
jgi:hypothetical protein